MADSPTTKPRSRGGSPHTVSGMPVAVQNGTKRQRAAILLAEDDLTDEQIAEVLNIGRTTLSRWKTDPEFNAAVGDYRGKIIADALRLPIAKKHERVKVLNDLHTRSLRVIADRAERHVEELDDPDSAINATRRIFGTDTPAEAATGLLVRQESVNASGMKTVNWAVDTGLMKEIRDLHKQAAQELGQWVERSASDVNQTTTVQIIGPAHDAEDVTPFVLAEAD